MKNAIYLFFVIILFFSCKKEEIDPQFDLVGNMFASEEPMNIDYQFSIPNSSLYINVENIRTTKRTVLEFEDFDNLIIHESYIVDGTTDEGIKDLMQRNPNFGYNNAVDSVSTTNHYNYRYIKESNELLILPDQLYSFSFDSKNLEIMLNSKKYSLTEKRLIWEE